MSLTVIIIFITAATSLLALNNPDFFYKLKFNASLIYHNKQYYRFLTYGFVHADLMHLLVNMFVLFSFGSAVERNFAYYFGLKSHLYFLLLYIGGIAFSTLASFNKHKNNDWYNAVGASGAVAAVLFSSILMDPNMGIMFIFFPVSIPGWVFGILYLVYSAYMAKKAQDNIGHDAHFWGAVFGFAFTIILNPGFFRIFITNIF